MVNRAKLKPFYALKQQTLELTLFPNACWIKKVALSNDKSHREIYFLFDELNLINRENQEA